MSYFHEEKNVAEYIQLADGFDGKELIEILKGYLSLGSSVLELGMGPGKDLDMLVKIGKRVTGQLDLQEILNQVVEAAVKIAEAEEGTLLLVDQASGELYQYASTDQQGLGKPLRLPVADSLAGQVVQSCTPLVITGEDLQKIQTQYYFRDVIYLPLLVKDEAIGVLSVLNRESSSGFAPHTLPMLSVL